MGRGSEFNPRAASAESSGLVQGRLAGGREDLPASDPFLPELLVDLLQQCRLGPTRALPGGLPGLPDREKSRIRGRRRGDACRLGAWAELGVDLAQPVAGSRGEALWLFRGRSLTGAGPARGALGAELPVDFFHYGLDRSRFGGCRLFGLPGLVVLGGENGLSLSRSPSPFRRPSVLLGGPALGGVGLPGRHVLLLLVAAPRERVQRLYHFFASGSSST